uniref:Uncharacterized protein n=1 Tax=viral metagenome TaxID=1070528 RepID=A0A6M3J6J1_9ZZZZ
MKDGDKFLEELRNKAQERDKRYMEYLLTWWVYDPKFDYTVPYRIDGSAVSFNWN